ncbi:hypothetical protein Hanom_Chr15g01358581 [Helianthus anomalus]
MFLDCRRHKHPIKLCGWLPWCYSASHCKQMKCWLYLYQSYLSTFIQHEKVHPLLRLLT